MINRLSYKQEENIFAVLAALIGFAVYWRTLCPTINFIDSGELGTVCYTLGIAHPTGYPLFTILGYCFSHLPLGLRVIHQLNVFAAVCCAAGLLVFFKFLVFFTNELLARGKSQQKDPKGFSIFTFLPAFVGTLVLGFSETYWSQALSLEVYSLQMVFLTLLLLLFTKAVKSDQNIRERNETGGDSRYWYLFAYVLGLSFTNHLTTSFLAPAFLTAYFYFSGFSSQSLKRIGIMSIPFILGLSVYLYLPIRALHQPIMNWGNPVDAEKLLWHFSGKVYHVWFLESMDAVIKQFKLFVETLPERFAYIGLVIAIVGAWRLFKSSRPGIIFTLLLFVGCAVIASFYDIHDIETYFLLADIIVGVWIALGIKHIVELKTDRNFKRIVALTSVALVVLVASVNFSNVDESETTIVENYAKDMFASIKQNGIVISYEWDYFISAAYYLQVVEGYRPDVIVIDKELLRRTWYYPQLKTRYPWLIAQSKPELDEFLKELYKFEHDVPYKPSVIEHRYTLLIRSLVEKNWNSRPVYITPEIEQQYISPYKKVPSGLALQLVPPTTTQLLFNEMPDFHIEKQKRMDKYRTAVISLYREAYMNNGNYLQALNRVTEANQMIVKVKEMEGYLTPAE